MADAAGHGDGAAVRGGRAAARRLHARRDNAVGDDELAALDRFEGRARGSGGLDPTMARLQARERFDGAVAAAGPGLSDILWRVVCMGEGLETAERALSWPARAAKLVLCLALDRVADHYKVA